MTRSDRRVLSPEEQMPRAAVAMPWPLALPWLLGLLIVYILKAAIYIVGFTIVLVIAVVQMLRGRER